MIYNSIEDWRKEAVVKFGEDWKKWKFKCFSCAKEQTGEVMIKKGIAENDARNQVYQKCCYCDYKSYGFIHSGIAVKNEGKETYVLEFAD